MAVAFDAITISQVDSSTTNSFNHTPAGTPSAVFVRVSYWDKSTALSTITYGGVSMALISGAAQDDGDGERVEIWGLATTATGAQAVVVTWAGATYSEVSAETVTGSDPSTLTSNVAVNAALSASPTVTITSATGELVLVALAGNTDVATVTTGDTQEYSALFSGVTGAGSRVAGASSVTSTWTKASGGNWSGAAISVKAGAPAGSPYTLTAATGTVAVTGQAATLKYGPWQLVGIGSLVSVTAASHALTVPAGVAQNDLLVAVISSRIASTTSITLPSGGEWTLVAESKSNNVLTTGSALASGMMAYCVRGASNPNLTFTHPTAPSIALGRIVAYRGVNTASPKDTQNAVLTAISTTSVNVAGVTTAGPGELLVVGLCGGQEAAWSAVDATNPSVASGATNTTQQPTYNTWLERADDLTTTGADTSLAIADAVKAAAGATGNITATASVAAGHVVIIGAFKPVPVSLAPYTMPAAAGAFTLTGQTAGLKVTRVLTAAQAAFTLTGQAAVLRFSHQINTAPHGAFTLTGQTATLRAAHTPLAAGLGTVTVAGQNVTLTKSAALAMLVDAGAFTLTGQAVALRVTRKLVAAQGTVTLTGQTVTLRYARVPMVAAPGALTLTGQTAALRTVRKLTAVQGSFTLTGQSTVLRVALPAVHGAFTLTGQSVVLRVTLPAAAGTVTVTGQPATLRRTRIMSAATGTVTVSGPAVILDYSAEGDVGMPAGIGLIAVNRQAATLRYTHIGVSAHGAFTLTGQTVLLKRSWVMSAATGMVAVTGQPANLVFEGAVDYTMAAAQGSFAVTGNVVSLDVGRATQLEIQPGRLTFGRKVSVRRW